MDETTRSARTARVIAAALATLLVTALMALAGATSASATTATTAGTTVAAGAKSLGSCKKQAVSACRKVTARKCRVSSSKKARAAGTKVSKRRIAATCAKRAKRHCKSAAAKRNQKAAARRCASRTTAPAPGPLQGAAASTGITPSGANTGVPAGTRLKVVRGDMTITTPGTVLSGLDIRGFVRIRANNVTIENTIIRGRDLAPNVGNTLLGNWDGNTGLVVRNSSLIGNQEHKGLGGFKGGNASLDRVEIASVIDSMQVFGGNVSVTNSWLHSNLHLPDSNYSDGWSHDDSIQIEGGSNYNIVNNSLSDSHTAAIMITQNNAVTSSINVAENVISGGACSINIAEKGRGAIAGLDLTDNKFGPSNISNCPVIAPSTSVPRMTRNVWVHNGAPIAVRRGA